MHTYCSLSNWLFASSKKQILVSRNFITAKQQHSAAVQGPCIKFLSLQKASLAGQLPKHCLTSVHFGISNTFFFFPLPF